MAQNGQKTKPRRSWLVAVIAIAGIILLVALLFAGRKDPPVQVARTVRSGIATTISTNGKIRPVDNFEAHAPSSTIVTKILVHEGDQVKAGQLLVQLDDADARAQAARARAQLQKAEADQQAIKSG